ncbi:MAG: LysR family transcriptional regulator [Rhodanobacteraceae bacterium]|nr:LysR family transcriptional regulator [Rhodanobacteraceae bacterium]
MAMDSLMSRRVFCLVAEQKSFIAAARHFDISATMVSKHVQYLEERIGARLLNRTSRSVSLTEVGAKYFEQTRRLLETLDEVEAEAGQATATPRGLLRLSAPVWLANPHFAGLLVEFHARCPEVRVEVDLSGHFVNMVEENFDLVLRATRNPDDTLIIRPVTQIAFPIVGSPKYLANRGRPRRIADLSQHTMLSYAFVGSDEVSLRGPDGEEAVRYVPALVSNNETLLHLAALHGMGLAFMPLPLVSEDLSNGRLEIVLPEFETPKASLYAVYPSRQYLSAKVRTFVDFLVESYRRI